MAPKRGVGAKKAMKAAPAKSAAKKKVVKAMKATQSPKAKAKATPMKRQRKSAGSKAKAAPKPKPGAKKNRKEKKTNPVVNEDDEVTNNGVDEDTQPMSPQTDTSSSSSSDSDSSDIGDSTLQTIDPGAVAAGTTYVEEDSLTDGWSIVNKYSIPHCHCHNFIFTIVSIINYINILLNLVLRLILYFFYLN